MGTPTQYYVDPSIDANSGSGTIGDPYGDLQHALDSVTRDATDGDQFNIKAGTDEVLTATLDFTTYGTPGRATPVIFRGYTSTANDGGIGGISGAGSYSIAGQDYLRYTDMHLHNSGSADIISDAGKCVFLNCEIDNTTGTGLSSCLHTQVLNCHLHNIGDRGIYGNSGDAVVYGCLFENGVNGFSDAISLSSSEHCIVAFNVFNIDGSTDGIVTMRGEKISFIVGNTIYADAGTGYGIRLLSFSTEHVNATVLNNIIEGFSGTGGTGLRVDASQKIAVYGSNKFYNNSTKEDIVGDVIANLGNNDTLTESPFVDAANGDFRLKPAYRATGYPSTLNGLSVSNYLDPGALQRLEFSARARATLGLG